MKINETNKGILSDICVRVCALCISVTVLECLHIALKVFKRIFLEDRLQTKHMLFRFGCWFGMSINPNMFYKMVMRNII